MKHIAIIPGDGIGVDVTREAVKVLERAQQVYDFKLELTHFDWSADKYLKEGVTLPEGALVRISQSRAVARAVIQASSRCEHVSSASPKRRSSSAVGSAARVDSRAR